MPGRPRTRPGASWGPQINVATDCPAFLLRAEMAGEERQPDRWKEIADYATKWFGKSALGFVDMHTALAYAMAGDKATLATFVESPRGATADMLPAINRFPHKPLIYNIVWKTVIYFVLAGFIMDKADVGGRIVEFLEKPKQPPAMPGDPTRSLASMEIGRAHV